MKILRYLHRKETRYGTLEDDGTIKQLVGSPFDGIETDGVCTDLVDVRVLAPVPRPRLIGVGLNYAAHAAEGGKEPPPIPMLFMLPWTTVVGQGDEVVYPVQGLHIEYEGELVVIIGKEAKDVSAANALDHVLGYTCGNDISERVIQRQEMSQGCVLMGKGFDTFKPMGPYIATDLDPTELELTTRLNGEVRQHTSTSDLIFPVARLIEYISDGIKLLPGDVIYTGTPAGVGPVAPGDSVEVEISGIGVLKNTIVAEET